MKAFLTALILLSCACPFVSAQDVKRGAQDTRTSDTKHQSRPKYVADEMLVKFDGGPSTGIADAANRAVGSSKVEDLGDTGWQRVKIPAGMTVDQAVAQYQ